jgi:hypothetical protein
VGKALVVDWAPHPHEGDKLLFIFQGGILSDETLRMIRREPREIQDVALHAVPDLPQLAPDRLARRIALAAGTDICVYAEHGIPQNGQA